MKIWHEPVATDTVHSVTPTADDGSTFVQLFVNTKTLVTCVYGMKKDKQFVNSLEKNIRKRGAMKKLILDSDKSEISNRSKDTLHALFIDDWQSDSCYQHQNLPERKFQTTKMQTNTLLDRTGLPPYTWLLFMIYVFCVKSHLQCNY